MKKINLSNASLYHPLLPSLAPKHAGLNSLPFFFLDFDFPSSNEYEALWVSRPKWKK